jgi:hypothetical protein
MTRRGGIMILVGGEAALGKEKGGDNGRWVDANLTGQKMKKIHAVHSVVTIDGEDLK